jgi:hypothetical protein
MAKVVEETGKGLDYLMSGKFQAAIKRFTKASSAKGTNLQRAVATMFAYETAKYRREWKKRNFGNANLFAYFESENIGKAWSDVDIAAVLLSPNVEEMNVFLAKFLGRNLESIRFQRRYAYGRPLMSWLSESGKRYTRYTQTKSVRNRLGM